jgi:hypothetical protein
MILESSKCKGPEGLILVFILKLMKLQFSSKTNLNFKVFLYLVYNKREKDIH